MHCEIVEITAQSEMTLSYTIKIAPVDQLAFVNNIEAEDNLATASRGDEIDLLKVLVPKGVSSEFEKLFNLLTIDN